MHRILIRHIRSRIRSGNLQPCERDRLLNLTARLGTELSTTSLPDRPAALRIAFLADRSTALALAHSPDNSAMQKLRDSAARAEIRYPRIAAAVNEFCMLLAGIGI